MQFSLSANVAMATAVTVKGAQAVRDTGEAATTTVLFKKA
jgi:hypothetical protein